MDYWQWNSNQTMFKSTEFPFRYRIYCRYTFISFVANLFTWFYFTFLLIFMLNRIWTVSDDWHWPIPVALPKRNGIRKTGRNWTHNCQKVFTQTFINWRRIRRNSRYALPNQNGLFSPHSYICISHLFHRNQMEFQFTWKAAQKTKSYWALHSLV